MKIQVLWHKEGVGLVVCDRDIHCYMGREIKVGMKKDWGRVGHYYKLWKNGG